jgi:hypothetical protein
MQQDRLWAAVEPAAHRGFHRSFSTQAHRFLGHATATMTLRYMKHAPEAYLDEDAVAIAAHMMGQASCETIARVEAARRELKLA